MPLKSDHTFSIKDFITITNKESSKHKPTDPKNLKQTNKNINMIREATNGAKLNTQKNSKEEKKDQEDSQNPKTSKRDAPFRSLLEGNPGKK